jgi:hypothetical protein
VLSDHDRTMHLHAEGTEERWWVPFGPDGTTTARTGREAELTVRGTASDLYVLVWIRPRGNSLRLKGDPELLERYREGITLPWG